MVPPPRPEVAGLHPYIPGEQPRDPGHIKLNTNENPYPPSPCVADILGRIGPSAIRKYPDPVCTQLRETIAGDLAITPAQVMVTNGSDEILRLAVEAFAGPGHGVAYLWPTYSLYPVFVAKQGAREVRLPWSLNGPSQEEALIAGSENVKILFVANPNPPHGLPIEMAVLRGIAERHPNMLVVSDEAYIAYGGESAIELVRAGYENILVTRSFSKSHSLAGMRVGFGVGHPALMEMLGRIKDSYNVSAAAQAAAMASWSDVPYTTSCIARIVATRRRMIEELRAMGFEMAESCGNFIFARGHDAPGLHRHLRERKVLVRYFDAPELRDGIRITVGTDEETDALLVAAREWVSVRA